MEMTWRDLTDPSDWHEQRDTYGEALSDAELSGAFDDPDPEHRRRDNDPGPLTRYGTGENGPF